MHLVNLSGCPSNSSGYLEEHLPVGPLQIAARLPEGLHPQRAVCRVTGEVLSLSVENGWAHFSLPQLIDHELIVLE